jgi:hypothetical protein
MSRRFAVFLVLLGCSARAAPTVSRAEVLAQRIHLFTSAPSRFRSVNDLQRASSEVAVVKADLAELCEIDRPRCLAVSDEVAKWGTEGEVRVAQFLRGE